MLGRMIHRSITAVIMAAASLTRPFSTLLSLLQAGNNAMARMIPHTTGEIKGLKILKHSAIKRAITPIRIAMSIAGLMYAFSRAILSGSFIRIPPTSRCCLTTSKLFISFTSKSKTQGISKSAKHNTLNRFEGLALRVIGRGMEWRFEMAGNFLNEAEVGIENENKRTGFLQVYYSVNVSIFRKGLPLT
jgi:hypothetical protein